MQNKLCAVLTFIIVLMIIGSASALGETIELSNDEVTLSFTNTTSGIRLSEIRDNVDGKAFQNDNTQNFWEVQLRHSDTGRLVPVNQESGNHEFTHMITTEGSRKSLFMTWSNLEVSPEGLSPVNFNIQISVELNDGSHMSEWRVESALIDGDEYSIFKVEFPKLNLLTAGSGEDDYIYFAHGHQTGSKINNPSKSTLNITGLYPSAYPYQFAGFCDGAAGKGIYFAAHDPDAYFKEFSFLKGINPAKSDTKMSVIQIPEYSITTKNYQSPYPAVIGPYTGDWYDGSMLYRSWALQQKWVTKKLYEQDEYRFLSENPFMISLSYDQTTYNYLDAYKKKLGLDRPILLLFDWQQPAVYHDSPNHYPVKSGLDDTVRNMQALGTYVIAYSTLWAWNGGVALQESPQGEISFEQAKQFFVRNSTLDYVSSIASIHSDRPIYSIYTDTDIWRNVAKDVIVERGVKQHGFDSFYMDGSLISIDYDSFHGHPPGGGTYAYDGNLRFTENILSEAKKQKNDFGLLTEILTESTMRNILLRTVLYNFKRADTDTFIPISQSLYHDYFYMAIDDLLDVNLYFTIKDVINKQTATTMADIAAAHSYIYGGLQRKAEWTGNPNGPQFMNEFGDHFVFLGRGVNATISAANYTFFGEFMRPLDVTFNYESIYSQYPAVKAVYDYFVLLVPTTKDNLPPVLSSVWRSYQGDIGIFFSNYNDYPIPFSFTFDFSKYGMETGKGYGLYNRTGDDLDLIGVYSSSFVKGMSVSNKTFLFVEFREMPKFSSFGGSTTSFTSAKDITKVRNAVIEKPDHGKIEFGDKAVNFEGLDLDAEVRIESNLIELDVSQLNRRATLTLYNLNFSNPVILKNGNACQECQKISYHDGKLVFTVQGFSAYSAAEGPRCGNNICESGETCSNCPGDCGACQPPPGGGGEPPGSTLKNCAEGNKSYPHEAKIACGTDIGECKSGEKACNNGAWGSCIGEVGPVKEVCDGKDNDCDGKNDEDFPCVCGTKKACGSSIGICSEGVQSCSAGNWTECSGGVWPVKEICDNGLDDDCDGLTDLDDPECDSFIQERCANGKQDEGEEGIDCGGPCPKDCIDESWWNQSGVSLSLIIIGVGILILSLLLYYFNLFNFRNIRF